MAIPEFKKLLNHDWTIKRKSQTPDGIGGRDLTRTILATVRGRLTPKGKGQQREIALNRDIFVTHTLFVDHGTDIQKEDIVESDDGKTVRVVAVNEPAQADHHLEVEVELITPSPE